MATGINGYGGGVQTLSAAVVLNGTCVVCGLPQAHPAGPPVAGGGTEVTYQFTRTDGVFIAHPTCWRLFHASQPFAVYV